LSPLDLMTAALLVVGAAFFGGGTLGLLRFPDSLSRLHALAKADNLGLGFVVAGLVLQAGSVAVACKLVLIWVIAMVAGSSGSYLIARHTLRRAEDREKRS
jgi:multicomponent Na+:H+ antiporter subunit G